MRGIERDDQEKRPRGIAPPQPFDRFGDGPVDFVQGFIEMPRARNPAVAVDAACAAAEPAAAGMVLADGKVAIGGKFVVGADDQVLMFKAEAFVSRPLVHGAADERGLVAGPAQLFRQRGGGMPFHAILKANHAVRRGELAGQQRPPRGHARRACRVALAEPGAVTADGVEVGRLHHGMARQGQAIAAVLIGHEHENVGAVIRHENGLRGMTTPRIMAPGDGGQHLQHARWEKCESKLPTTPMNANANAGQSRRSGSDMQRNATACFGSKSRCTRRA